MDFYKLIRDIKELNMGAEILVGSPMYDSLARERIFCSIPGDKLKLPEGFYYNEKNGITNKHNTESGAYISIKVVDIPFSNEYAHDILEVGLDGLTKEEKNEVSSYQEFNKPEDFVEPKKTTIRERLLNGRNRLVGGINSIGDKFVCKSTGLFSRIKNKLKYTFTKREEVDLKKEIDEVNHKEEDNKEILYRENIRRVLKAMENDTYILNRIKKEMGVSLRDAYMNNPKELSEELDGYYLIKLLHDFAKNDPKYEEDMFVSLSRKAVNVLDENPTLINDMLKEINSGSIRENQMQYLNEKLNDLKKIVGAGTKKKKKRKISGGGGRINSSTKDGRVNPTERDENPVKETKEEPKEEPKVEEKPTPKPFDSNDDRITKITNDFLSQKRVFFNKLGEHEKMFIEDVTADSLEPSDIEFRQMLNERTVDKNAIINYYNDINDLRRIMALEYSDYIKEEYNKLDDIDKSFIDDAKAETINPGDNEFMQMMSERVINKKNVLNYYKAISQLEAYNQNVEEHNKEYNDLKEFFQNNFTDQNVIEPLDNTGKSM